MGKIAKTGAALLGIWMLAAGALGASGGTPAGTKDGDPVGGDKVNQLLAVLSQYYPLKAPRGEYLGADFCLFCHSSYATWRDTKHASFLRRPRVENSLVPRRGVIADFDENGVDDFLQGLDFNLISSPFDRYKPNAPVLGVHESGTYFVDVGALRYPVTFAQAGQGDGSSQRYALRVPVADSPTGYSRSNYLAPLRFDPGRGWQPDSPERWYDEGNQPRFGLGTTIADLADHGGNYSATCVGCHATGIRRVGQSAAGEVTFDGFVAILGALDDPTLFDYNGDGRLESMNVGCESCHGPGALHVASGGDPELIVNPARLPVSAQVDICGRCHSQRHSVPGATFDWPYNDEDGDDWTPLEAADGTPLSDFSAVDPAGLWPDGKHSRVRGLYDDFLQSGKPGFAFDPVSCSDCHDPHAEAREHQLLGRRVEDGVAIDVRVEDNTLCLSCHAGFGDFAGLSKQTIADIGQEANRHAVAKAVSAHAEHPYGAERGMGLGRCVECHMTPMAGYDELTARTHSFEAVGPHKTLEFQDRGGMPNSCAQSCHGNKVNSFELGLDPNPDNSVWNQPFDRSLAGWLVRYFGPGGMWWDTSE